MRGLHDRYVRYAGNGSSVGTGWTDEDAGSSGLIELDRDSEALFNRVAKSLPLGVLLFDDTGALTAANRESERQFGYAHTELIGQPIEGGEPQR